MSGHVLFKHMKLSRICHARRHVMLEGMSKQRTGFIGWHDMLVGMYYWKICVSGGCLS